MPLTGLKYARRFMRLINQKIYQSAKFSMPSPIVMLILIPSWSCSGHLFLPTTLLPANPMPAAVLSGVPSEISRPWKTTFFTLSTANVPHGHFFSWIFPTWVLLTPHNPLKKCVEFMFALLLNVFEDLFPLCSCKTPLHWCNQIM